MNCPECKKEISDVATTVLSTNRSANKPEVLRTEIRKTYTCAACNITVTKWLVVETVIP